MLGIKTKKQTVREYPYNGETDKKSINWLKDADKIAFDNCAPNEDVLGYNLVEVGENESLSEAQERQAKIEVCKVYSWYDVYVDNVLLLKHLSEEDAKDIMKTMDDNNYPYIYRETEESRWADEQKKGKVTEDTIKQGSQWVNKGKEGTHGKFNTKKEADAQRKAMFSKGFVEGLYRNDSEEDEYDDFELASIYGGDFSYCPICGTRMEYDDGYNFCPRCKKSGDMLAIERRFGKIKEDVDEESCFDYNGHKICQSGYGYEVTFDNGEQIQFADDREAMEYIDSLGRGEPVNESVDLPNDYVFWQEEKEITQEQDDALVDFIKDFFDISSIEYKDMEVTVAKNQRDADDWDEDTYTIDWEYKLDETNALNEVIYYLSKKFPKRLTVKDIKDSEKEVYDMLRDKFQEDAVDDATKNFNPSDYFDWDMTSGGHDDY